MKKILLTLIIMLPLMAMCQVKPYTADEWLQLFPKINPEGLHVYYDDYHENYSPESVLKDKPVGRFLGTPLETRRCKILAEVECNGLSYYYEQSLKNPSEDYSPIAFAIGRFDLDNDHQALVIRHHGEYEASQITLFVWDNSLQQFEGRVSLANSSGDAGTMWEHQSWLSVEKEGLVVKTHDIWYYHDIDTYFNELDALDGTDTTKLPILKMIDFNSQMIVSRWVAGRFVADTIRNPNREDGYPLIDGFSEDLLAWAARYSGKADSLGMDYAWVDDKSIATPPQFLGGERGISLWLKDNLKLPAKATGKVWVLLKISQEGEIAKTLLLKDGTAGIGPSVCQLLLQMPQWLPARASVDNLDERYLPYKNARVESQHVLKLNFKKGQLQ